LREIVDLAQNPAPRLRYASIELGNAPEGGGNFRTGDWTRSINAEDH
jgi:hypothetical protein